MLLAVCHKNAAGNGPAHFEKLLCTEDGGVKEKRGGSSCRLVLYTLRGSNPGPTD